jgi:hypothetical protein
MRDYSKARLAIILVSDKHRFAICKPYVQSVVTIPRRNGHYININGETQCLQEWARRSRISHNILCNTHKRHGFAGMVRLIKLGLKGEYVRHKRLDSY